MSKIKICLDPGHSGRENRSPVVPEYYESEVMLAYGLRLRDALRERGFEVVMTRTTPDEAPELQARGRMSEGCACFLSLHQNYADRASADHVVAIHQTEDNSEVTAKSAELATLLGPVVAEIMGTAEPTDIRQKVATTDKNKDGQFNDNWYGVLNGARIVGTPGVIVEHSFYSNKAMALWMMDADNQQKLADNVADALANYYGLRKEKTVYTVTATITTENDPAKLIASLEALGAKVSVASKTEAVADAPVVPAAPKPSEAPADIDAIARDVIDGKYGNGQERREKLGDLYAAVQKRVNELLK